MSERNFLSELKRRNVYKVAVAYVVVSWLLIQAASILLPTFEAPPWVMKVIVVIIVLGFPAALIFSWAFEITPEGIKLESEITPNESIARKTGRKIVAITVVFAIIAAALFVFQFIRTRSTSSALQHASAITGKSIAVLPFADLSPSHDQESFSDGMAEEILNALAHIKDLKVVGRASSFFYKGKNVSLKQIGSELGVANILEGSVRKQGEQVRINSALSRAADGLQVWSKNYDGTLSNIFDLQESCARDIASELKVALVDPSEARLVEKSTENMQAYALFVEAQALVSRRIGDSLPRAIALLREVTRLDPKFARAWAKLAVALAVEPQYANADWETNWAAADQAAHQAIDLDPNSAEAYAALGYIDFSRRRYREMVEPAQRAIDIDPDNVTANFWMANQLAGTGRTADAEAINDRALKLDPGNGLVLFYKGLMRWRSGDNDGALILAHRANWFGPLSGMLLCEVAARNGQHERGAEEFARGFGVFRSEFNKEDLRLMYRGVFQDESARKPALEIVDRHPHDALACTLFLMLGEPQKSFVQFEQYGGGISDGYLNWLWLPNDYSRKARQHPNFQDFAKRIGLVDYWKANRWPDLCQPAAEIGPDAFTCK